MSSRPWIACKSCSGSWVFCDRRIPRCSICKQFFPKQGTTYAEVAARAVGKPKGRAAGKAAVASSQAHDETEDGSSPADSSEEQQDFSSIPKLVEAIAKLSPPQKGNELVVEVLQARLQALRAAKSAQQPLSFRFRSLEQRLQKATKASEGASEKVLAKAKEIEELKQEYAELLLGEIAAKEKVEALQAEVSNARKDIEATPPMAITCLGEIACDLQGEDKQALERLQAQYQQLAEKAAARRALVKEEQDKVAQAAKEAAEKAKEEEASGTQSRPPSQQAASSMGSPKPPEEADVDMFLEGLGREAAEVQATEEEKRAFSVLQEAWLEVKRRKKVG